MIIPACRGDAGAATVLVDVTGSSKVATTPSPNSAINTTNVSGLRFTDGLLSINKPMRPICVGVTD